MGCGIVKPIARAVNGGRTSIGASDTAGGRVVLQGRTQPAEIDALVEHVKATAGVTEVVNRLMPHDAGDGDPQPASG